MLLAYFGHHKCATTWITDILVDVCDASGMRLVRVAGPRYFDGDLAAHVRRSRSDLLAYINADQRFASQLSDFRGFHVVRDPRDIAVSAYFSHLHSHPTDAWPALVSERERLEKLSMEEGLLVVMDFLQPVYAAMEAWDYAQPNVLEMRMEKVTAEPQTALLKAFAFLGLLADGGISSRNPAALALNTLRRASRGVIPFNIRRLPEAEVIRIIEKNSFAAKTGRQPGQEDVKSHYRKGVAGEWAEVFKPRHRDYFKERYGNLVLKLGYEKDSHW